MSTPKESEPSFNEFEDREYSDWKRIRSAIEHENTLINYRQTWLLTSQAFLLTAFGSLLIASNSTQSNENENFLILLIVIPTVGIAICAILQRALNAAEDYLIDLDRWWYYKLSLKQSTNEQDNIHSQEKNNKWKSLSWESYRERTKSISTYIADHPPIQGWTGHGFSRLFHYPITPVLFIILWFIILVFVTSDSISIKMLHRFLEYIAVSVITLAIVQLISRVRK